jgi:hypothetical protein
MTEPFPGPAMSTFVVRFWQEWSVGRARWRGRIEHIPSGRSVAFLDEEVMWQFIQGFGIVVDDASQSETADRSSPSSHR